MTIQKFLSIAAAGLVALGAMNTTPAVAAQTCEDDPKPATVNYGAPDSLKGYLGRFNGRLGEDSDKVCVSVYVEHMTAEGFVEGKYAVGDWESWNIESVVHSFTGKIDPETGRGKIHPDVFAISVEINPEAGTMYYLFHGRSTDTPGSLVRVEGPQ